MNGDRLPRILRQHMGALLLFVSAYLCGSIPVGVVVGRFAGIDVRRSGSGNIGATNVARTAGGHAGLLTLLGDIAKGVVPALIARTLWAEPWVAALAALAAVLGHLFSVFLRFAGGKGVATAFGAFLALTPAAAGLSALAFAVAAFSTHYVSLASVLAALLLPVFALLCSYSIPAVIVATVVAFLIVMRHRANLARLRRGEEPRFRVARRRAQ